jgi:hypothetical protein
MIVALRAFYHYYHSFLRVEGMTLFRVLNTIGNDTCSIVLFFFRTYAGQGMMKFRCTLGEHPRYGTREHRESCLSKILLGYERFSMPYVLSY